MFEEKLKFKQLKDYFPEFLGENTLADSLKFYAEKGELLQAAEKGEKNDRNAARKVSFVSTNGLDTELINVVLTTVCQTISVQYLTTFGML